MEFNHIIYNMTKWKDSNLQHIWVSYEKQFIMPQIKILIKCFLVMLKMFY